jgi:transketolase
MDAKELIKLKDKAKHIRRLTLDAIGNLGFGHIGGAMSIVEILVMLYYKHMSIDSSNPKKPDRDLLILSKGHGGPTLYSVLADKGYFPVELLRTLNIGGTTLPSHADMNRTPGIDMTAGSLGQGLSAAVGMALANRLDKNPGLIYTIIGDGESDEGQVWEAAMAASHFKLDNLIVFTDHNKLQIDGFTKNIMDLGDLRAKWESFGWFTQQIDGHNFEVIDKSINRAKTETSRPAMIILETVKGKGVSFAENKESNHHMTFDYEMAKQAISCL